MQLFHHHHQRTLHRVLHSDFWLFELSVWLHVFARSLVSVFIPILLLQLDYTISEVVLYYFLYHLFDVPLNFLARFLTKKIGARLVIALGTLASIAFFGILYILESGHWPLLMLLALFAAIYDSLYWVAHIYFFMESSKGRKNASKDTSFLSIVRQLGGLLAPVFGALILVFWNDQALIALSVFFLGLSMVPLLRAKHVKGKPKQKLLNVKTFFQSGSELRDYVVMSLYGMHGAAEGIIWPMFIFLLFESIESVAIIPIIVSVTTILFTYIAGNVKKSQRAKAVILSGVLVALAWILRIVLQVPFYYYASIFLIGLFTVFITVPIDSAIYEKGEKKDSLTASTYRNAFSMFFRCILFGILALLTNVFHISFLLAAGSMMIIVVLMIVIRETKSPTTPINKEFSKSY